MTKEVLQLQAECDSCGRCFNLDDDLIDVDWNMTIPQALKEKYGNSELLCTDCRGILRVTEEGSYKLIMRKEEREIKLDLVLISKENERMVIKIDENNLDWQVFK